MVRSNPSLGAKAATHTHIRTASGKLTYATPYIRVAGTNTPTCGICCLTLEPFCVRNSAKAALWLVDKFDLWRILVHATLQ